MGQRLKLQELLEEVLDSDEVWYQPPSNRQLNFPAIVYNVDGESRKSADNGTYNLRDRWFVTIIDRDPDSPARERFKLLPMVTFSRSDVIDGLNHFYYSIYF